MAIHKIINFVVSCVIAGMSFLLFYTVFYYKKYRLKAFALRRVISTRGTTQIVAFATSFRVHQLLCVYAAITESAYSANRLWDFQLGRDKISICFYRAFT